MGKSQAHTIQKVTIDVFTRSTEAGKYMERTATDYFWEEILPILESHLDALAAQLENQTLEIPHLSFEFSLDPKNLPKAADLEAHFRSPMQELRNELHPLLTSEKIPGMTSSPPVGILKEGNKNSGIVDQKGIQLREDSERLFDAWLYFLRTGSLPWWCADRVAAQAFSLPFLVSELLVSTHRRERFRILLSEVSVRERLVRHHTRPELEGLLETIFGEELPFNGKTYGMLLQSYGPSERKGVVALLLAFFFHLRQRESEKTDILLEYIESSSADLRKRMEAAFGRQLENEFGGDIGSERSTQQRSTWSAFTRDVARLGTKVKDSLKKESASPFREAPLPEEVAEGENQHYLDRAGLILVHPFLPAFFADCEFLDKKGNLVQPELAAKAVHYLATLNESPFDFELVFEKFLCGISRTTVLSRQVQLPDAVKSKSEKLLESVILHWKKLKNTGSDTVRQEFLNRKGKLVIEESSDRLYVERRPQDVLLESLPWNLSLVKLPWRRKLIVVTW
jgi:hypothetical protein